MGHPWLTLVFPTILAARPLWPGFCVMPHQVFNELKVSVASGRSKSAKGLCQLQYCTEHRSGASYYCRRHKRMLYKVLDLVAYIYSLRKARAKQRGHEWTITIENFRDWCAYTGYHLTTGRTAASTTIERKDAAYGYHVWNITTLSLAENSAKGRKAAGGSFWLDEVGVMHYDEADSVPF